MQRYKRLPKREDIEKISKSPHFKKAIYDLYSELMKTTGGKPITYKEKSNESMDPYKDGIRAKMRPEVADKGKEASKGDKANDVAKSVKDDQKLSLKQASKPAPKAKQNSGSSIKDMDIDEPSTSADDGSETSDITPSKIDEPGKEKGQDVKKEKESFAELQRAKQHLTSVISKYVKEKPAKVSSINDIVNSTFSDDEKRMLLQTIQKGLVKKSS
jgi:hypothetical protein